MLDSHYFREVESGQAQVSVDEIYRAVTKQIDNETILNEHLTGGAWKRERAG
jgi:hypothetical protein